MTSLPSPSSTSSLLDSTPLDICKIGKCTLSEFLQLSYTSFDRYQLINGVLYHQQKISDSNHKAIQTFLKALLETYNEIQSDLQISSYTEASVARFDRGSTSSGRDSCVLADVAVGPHLSAKDRRRRSPRSSKIDFPPHMDPPLLVIEITSTNRANDLSVKIQEYARRKVPEYVIVDRQKNCVYVYKNPCGPAYSERQRFEGTQIVNARFLFDLEVTAQRMLDPDKSTEEIRSSPLRKEKRAREVAEEERDAEKKARKIAQEERDAERKARKIEQEERDAERKARKIEQEERDAERKAAEARERNLLNRIAELEKENPKEWQRKINND